MPLQLAGRSPDELQRLDLAGAAVCFLLDAVLLVLFVGRISRNLRARDARLADLRQHAAEEDHIVRMGLLASGAAHELGTPLSTVAVILNDWRRMPQLAADPGLTQELEDMEAEIARCKAIVTGILTSAGETRGDAPRVTTVDGLLEEVLEDWRGRGSCTLDLSNACDDAPIVSDTALKQALLNVLDNAAEASPGWVGLSAERRGDALVVTVRDAGPGFAPEMLAELGRPYRSSKGRTGGGLGLFLVVNVVRKLGGGVAARNRAARNGAAGGAEVVLTLPFAALGLDREAARAG